MKQATRLVHALAFLRWGTVLGSLLLSGMSAAQPGPGMPAAPQPKQSTALPAATDYTGENIADIRIVGTTSLDANRVLSRIRSVVGRPYSPQILREDVHRLYNTRWFFTVHYQVENTPQGVVIIFKVTERPVIQEVQFLGNKKLKERDLVAASNLRPGKPMDPTLNAAAAREIERKYQEKGYPFASVELVEGSKMEDRRVVMKITEGPSPQVTWVGFEGNKFVPEARLRTMASAAVQMWGVCLNPAANSFGMGKYDPVVLEEDKQKLLDYYRNNGFLDVQIGVKKEWSADREYVRVNYIVDEGPRYTIKDTRFVGNKAIDRGQLEKDLKLTSGAQFNQSLLNRDAQIVQSVYGRHGYIHAAIKPEIEYLDEPGVVNVVYKVKEEAPRRVGQIRIEGNDVTKARVIRSLVDLAPGELADTTKLQQSQANLINSRLFLVDGSPDGGVPTVEFDPANDPESEFQDLIVKVKEGYTGAMMLGAGVNSDNGVVGSFVLNERNFDILRFPTSFSDLFSGKAFRGAGQEFSLELVPGNLVNRYAVTVREPRFLGLDYGLTTSGSLFRRVWPNYSEERGGGRVQLFRRFTREITGSLQVRAENVRIYSPAAPIPDDMALVLGNNFQAGVRAGVAHDTRDSHLNPGKGHFVELAFEQTFGDFDYPRVTLAARQFWTLYNRPDGSGRHILQARGEVGYSGSDTPLFDRFYGGGFQSIRGFAFRGVSPTQFGQEIGGNFMLMSSLEYILPLSPDDSLAAVFFCDSGTVESEVEITNYRVALGFGLRVQVPAMGPVPLAFDFGFPIAKGREDDEQMFAFWVGWYR